MQPDRKMRISLLCNTFIIVLDFPIGKNLVCTIQSASDMFGVHTQKKEENRLQAVIACIKHTHFHHYHSEK